ncbi:MAG: tetratricopeptide repeat protein [Planctomycetes bacterium]|nr:tetratricopeptide repeat protein [Planctomycetota bacterium]MCW8135514.1 tetratricopeptide repeat protein [Planctomycetota bacterium]
MDVDDLLQQALIKHRDGDVEGAGAIYRQIIDEQPDHTAARLNLASLLLEQDDLDGASRLLQQVLAQDEDNGVAHLLYSRVCFMTGKHEQGYPHIRSAFELIPDEEGVAAEFVSAMRRQYFTFSQDEYLRLFEAAREGTLEPPRYQRLAHLAFLRIARPELIRLLVQPGLAQDTPDAINRWMEVLPEASRGELAILVRNFVQSVVLMFEHERYQPQAGTLTLRNLPDEQGPDTMAVQALEDCDTLTGATLELVTGEGLEFLPFSEIASIEFDQPGAATGAFVTMRDGGVRSGLMPLFYLFTEFAESEKVRQGHSTLLRPVIGEASVGVGLRALRTDGTPLPIVRIEKIEFEA